MSSLLSRGPRGTIRRLFVTFWAAVMTVSVAWAGAILAPVPGIQPELTGAAGAAFADVATGDLGEGTLEVGASAISLYPRPEDYEAEFPGATWLRGEENAAACTTLSESVFAEIAGDPAHGAHLVTAGPSPWPENPDCLYQGGFGIGPMNPILGWDSGPGDPGYVDDGDSRTGHGLYVRSIVLSDGEDEIVMTVIDAEGYLFEYANKCGNLGPDRADCGARGIAAQMGAELDIDPSAFNIAATHAHSAPDLLGGWGFVPDWYMAQVYDTITESIRQAHASRVPAVLEVGEERAREFNRERRDTYHSAEEQQVAWLRALDATDQSVIATVGAYAAHPTSFGNNGAVAHADWPGLFVTRLEENFGGVGFHFMTGLGNLSNAGLKDRAPQLADRIPAVGSGHFLADTDIRTARHTWQQPVTNAPLTALGLPGFFDRSFLPTPATIHTGKEPDTAPCLSAAATSVELQASAARIGSDFALAATPGEVFANLTNTIKEKSGALVTMPLGQTNDALGYMPQQFEFNEVGQQTGLAAGGYLVVNYEDGYAIDRCVGDMALETTLDLLGGL